MSEPEPNPPANIDQATEEIQMLVHVCRLIATRAPEPALADELRDFADALDRGVDRLREAVAALRASQNDAASI